MKYQCSICKTMFDTGLGASNCFYTHEDYMDYFLTEESDMEKVCQLAIEKKKPQDILLLLSTSSMHLSHLIDPVATNVNLIEQDDVRRHLRDAITGNLLLLTQAAYLFGDCDELDCAMKEHVRALKKDLKKEEES